MKHIFYIVLIGFFISCKTDLELTMERGIQLYDWDKIDESMIEFTNVINHLRQQSQLSEQQLHLLAQAHYNLGIAFSKIEEYNKAEQEVSTAISIVPKKEYREVLDLIQAKKTPS